MRGVFGTHLGILLWLALGAAAGCATKKASTVEGPLTPYSPVAATPGTPVTPAADPSAVTAAGSDPYHFNPATVDPLLEREEPKESFWDRVTEATSTKRNAERWNRFIGKGPDEAVAQHEFNEGDLAFREANFKDAAEHYKVAAQRWPDSQLQEDALFMLGECYFQMNRYPKSSDAYTKLVKKYENSRHLDMIIKRRFAIGRYWEQRTKEDPPSKFNFKDKSMPFWDAIGNTVAIYESIRMDDPTGPLADDATMATANTLFLNGRWEDAAYHYDLMRTEFPQSEFQPQAHLLGMQAKLRSYQGPNYDAKPLHDAQKLGRTLQTQYLAQLPTERENIQQAMKSIEAQLAERDYALGEFYNTTHHYAASKFYYSEVVKQYPQTKFADLAKTRIDEVKDKPQEPKNEIEWIASKFRRAPTLPARPAPAGAPGAPPAGVPGVTPPDQPFFAGPPPAAPGVAPQGPVGVAQQPQTQR